jgi:predicted Zn-dependent protease
MLLLLLGGLAAPPSPAGILKIPVDEEISVGREAAQKFERGQRMMDGPMLDRIQSIGERVARVSGRDDLPFTFNLVDSDSINAITFPGGFIYVFRGLMDLEPDDDELAGILGHEIAHSTKSHAFKRLLPVYLLRRAQVRLTGHERQNAVAAVAEMLTTRGLGRQFEYESDKIGVTYAHRAGFDPDGLLRVLEAFRQMEGRPGSRVQRLLETHPPAADRLKKLRPVVAGLKR